MRGEETKSIVGWSFNIKMIWPESPRNSLQALLSASLTLSVSSDNVLSLNISTQQGRTCLKWEVTCLEVNGTD